MPFHVISKITNGQLRNYLKHQTQHFYYEFNYLIFQCLYEMKFETLLRVRSGIGLKLVGIFGNYRSWKGIPQQVQLLSCQTNRKYSFEFIVQGKINIPSTVMQFSVLYTDLKGHRYFRIVTQMINLSSQMSVILPEINYQEVNEVYLRAILHNMDLTPHFRKLQLALQDRCKRHIKVLQQLSSQKINPNSTLIQKLIDKREMKKVRMNVIFTFMLMQHFLLNLHERRDIFLDINIEARSKLATYEDAMQIVWPLTYIINENGFQMVQMKTQNFLRGTVGILIDRGDRVELYLQKAQYRNGLRMTKDPKKAIQSFAQLQHISKLLTEIQERKLFTHLDILIVELQYIMSFCIFSRQGSHSFDNFIETILQD